MVLDPAELMAFVPVGDVARALSFYTEVLGFVVPSIADAVRTCAGSGVEFRRYDGMGQDELDIWVAPSGDRVAWFADSEGNTLSLTQAGEPNLAG